jgi:hypothetical protein
MHREINFTHTIQSEITIKMRDILKSSCFIYSKLHEYKVTKGLEYSFLLYLLEYVVIWKCQRKLVIDLF